MNGWMDYEITGNQVNKYGATVAQDVERYSLKPEVGGSHSHIV